MRYSPMSLHREEVVHSRMCKQDSLPFVQSTYAQQRGQRVGEVEPVDQGTLFQLGGYVDDEKTKTMSRLVTL